MYARHNQRSRFRHHGLLLASVVACGACGTADSPDGAGLLAFLSPATSSGGQLREAEGAISAHTESPFGEALTLEPVEGTRLSVDGRIDAPGDVVTYAIGSLYRGDRVIVEVVAATQGFDPAVGIFDSARDCIHLNDDRNYYRRLVNPYAELVAERYVEECYVVASSSVRTDSAGDFQLQILRTPGAPVRPPADQIVYLDFRGDEDVVIGRRSAVDVPKFSGAMIAPELALDTQEILRKLVERVRRDYLGFDVTIIGSHEGDPPNVEHSIVYFGSYNPALLGIADSVDAFNLQKAQEAIIFVDTFAVFMSQDPTVDEISGALANVASHEIGHLLGLHHTADPEGIMDTTASLRQMLRPQWFKRSPINSDTFDVGYQNAPLTLRRNVGGDPMLIDASRLVRRAKIYAPWYDEGPPDPIRCGVRFSTGCDCGGG